MIQESLSTSSSMLQDLNQTASQANGTNTGLNGNGNANASRCRNFTKILWFLAFWIKSIWKENGKSLLLVVLAFIIGVLIGWLLLPAYIQNDLNETVSNQTRHTVVNKFYCLDIPDFSIPENNKSLDFSTKANMKSFFYCNFFQGTRRKEAVTNYSRFFRSFWRAENDFFSLTRRWDIPRQKNQSMARSKFRFW